MLQIQAMTVSQNCQYSVLMILTATGGIDLPGEDNKLQNRKESPKWIQKAHLLNNVLSDREDRMMTSWRLATKFENVRYTLHIEPRNIIKILMDESCIVAMQEKLTQLSEIMCVSQYLDERTQM